MLNRRILIPNFHTKAPKPIEKKPRNRKRNARDDKVKHRRTKSGKGILNYCKPVLPEREENVESSGQIGSKETSSGGKCSNNTLDPNSTFPVETKSGEGNGNFEEVDTIKITLTAYQQFTDKHQKIPKDGKWTLSIGKVIEDTLYIFGMDQIDEIKNFNKKEFLLIPDDLLKYFNNFRKFNTADLRELIFRSDLRDQPFDRLKDFDYDWILLEYEANHLTKDHLEAWSFVDKAFLNIDGMKISSYTSTTPLKRKLMGQCDDLIVQKWHTEHEAGKIFEENNGTKIIKGGLKMPKMLRNMFNDLCEAMEIQESKIRKLETIGFIIAGLEISLIRLDLPVEHVYRLLRTRLFEIPTQVCEFGTKALPTISLIWKAKAIVKNVIRLMGEEDLTEEQQLLILQRCVEDGKGLRTLPPL
ncbi:hypothetical protein Glove_332g53 [Diversispora epigaea]|uniref:Uncharacterized protein n=1 Tax=Diversispora epigaea TaxID=1348612 RepID=A0A397HME9_9GLOM|nr:hypothetical protein Glove_332g53 [Diversispora epigaea]